MPDRPTPQIIDDMTEHVRGARQGSANSLTVLYHAFATQIYRTAYRIVGNRADAEDVLQDVYLGLPVALAQYREEGKLDAWLRRLAARTALMLVRRRRREVPFGEGVDPPGPEPSQAGVVERVAVVDALRRMPPALREVFLLKEIEGFTHREIAALLRITVGASEVRLHRAWLLMRDQLGNGEAS